MDTSEYKKEISKLERELAAIDTDKPSKSSSFKLPGSIGKYKSYFLILIGTFILLVFVKPKIVLTIKLLDDEPIIVVDKKKFIFTWLALSVLISFVYFLISSRKKD